MAAEVTPRPTPETEVTRDEDVEANDHVVHEAGTHQKGFFRWGYFVLLNAISAVAAIVLFIAIAHGESLDPYMIGTYNWLLAHPMATSAMAFSPLAASMLVGWGYSQRAKKRKAAAAAALARSADKAKERDAA